MLLGFLLAIMYMTNAFDALIYFGLTGIILWRVWGVSRKLILAGLGILGIFGLFSLPFHFNFKPFASVFCDYNFGSRSFPFFCFVKDRSAWWMFLILWGFFLFNGTVFGGLYLKEKAGKLIKSLTSAEGLVLILFVYSLILILTPEVIYFKDIYPQHYRANTMFKLGYQAFIMFSLASAFVFGKMFFGKKNRFNFIYFLLIAPQLFLVSIYPFFSVDAYFNGLKNYQGLDGLSYLKRTRPADFEAINWLNKNISGQPVVLEAAGDSYTDYERVSANTGLPTAAGWAVHEWLWRGSYEAIAPRITDVARIYETSSASEARRLLNKYKVEYVYIGELEKGKYNNLNEEKFKSWGELVYNQGGVRIFRLRGPKEQGR